MKKIVELPFKVLVQIIVVVRLFFLVVLYSIERMLPGLGIVSRAFDFLSQDKKEHYDIRTRNMISLAFKQVLFKSSRAIITIGAISIAMGTIMLLVSLGYGAQRAIVQRVASDLELVHIDILPQAGQKIVLNPDVIDELESVDSVEKVLPVIGVVGKVEYKGSELDVVAYGVTKDYLENSESIDAGVYFESNVIPSKNIEYVPVESEENVEEEEESEIGIDLPELSMVNGENLDEGIIPADELGQVEGASTDLEWIDLGAENQIQTSEMKVYMQSNEPLSAVISSNLAGMLDPEGEGIIGASFDITYVALENLFGITDRQVISETVKYEVVGVVRDDTQPLLYVPLDHVWSLGTTRFSQARAIVEKQEVVEDVRSEFESRGFLTKSIFDTISEIEEFFYIVRVVLGAVGMGALLVASLGMFNTLTVSLLERSKEIGLLKVLGMKPNQVYSLFITESLIMGLWGGVIGILIAFLGGKLISLLFSAVTLSRGGEFVDISYIPFQFLVSSFVLMIFLGFVTGVYPARRATKISALDALRYE